MAIPTPSGGYTPLPVDRLARQGDPTQQPSSAAPVVRPASPRDATLQRLLIPGTGSYVERPPTRSDSDESGDGSVYSSDDEGGQPAPAEPAAPQKSLYTSPLPLQGNDHSVSADAFTGVTRIRGSDIVVGSFITGGTFGEVYRGTWRGEPVALKEIDVAYARRNVPLSDEEIDEVLQWEVSRLATVDHAGVVQFHGVCRKDARTYLVMELCKGSLQGALKGGRIPTDRLWRWMREIAEALAYLHGQGLLHRDLKAANVLIDKFDRAKLADLGVAQVDELLQASEAKAVNKNMQDVVFTAPENIGIPEAGPRHHSSKASDVYALGTLFWQMVSEGAEPSPWRISPPYARAEIVAGRRMPIPADCPPQIRDLILSCWPVRPEDRADIAGVLRQLRAMGPALHPQAAIIESLGELDRSLHARRSQMRMQVPARVSAQAVEGRMEDYWAPTAVDAASSAATTATSATTSTASTTTTSATTTTASASGSTANPARYLEDVFEDFLAQNDPGALLLLGEAGLGKTLGTHLLAEHILKAWWRYLSTPGSANRPRYLPILLRDRVAAWEDTALQDACAGLLPATNAQEVGPQLLVIFDAYDECRFTQAQALNLPEYLGLPDDAKLIITCRPKVVKDAELDERFAVQGRLQVRHHLPFTLDQALDYLRARLDWDDEGHARYRAVLLQSAELRAVLGNPFVLYMLAQSWPTISRQPLESLTRSQIYAGFIRHLVEQGASLLASGVKASLQDNATDLAESYARVAYQTALQAAIWGGSSLAEDKALKNGWAWTRLPQLVEEEARQRYRERNAEVDALSSSRKTNRQRRMILTEEDFVGMRLQAARQMASSLPMRLRSGAYEFVHNSVFEYCVARNLLSIVKSLSSNVTDKKLEGLTHMIEEKTPGALMFIHEELQDKDGSTAAVSGADGDEVRRDCRMAHLYMALGAVFSNTDAHDKAMAYFHKAAEIRERRLGREDPDTAASYSAIGSLLQELGKFPEALDYLRRALDIRERTFGENSTLTAGSYNNLSLVYMHLDQPDEALKYLRKSLELTERLRGIEDSATATCYCNMGQLLSQLDRDEEALEPLQKSLAIRKKVCGPEHPDTAISHNACGTALSHLDRNEEALEHYEKAIAINEAVHGPRHTTTAVCYANIGLALWSLYALDKAIGYLQRALAIFEEVYGPMHHETLTAREHLEKMRRIRRDLLG
jgi:serine/threonine protein kinase/Tfp pilus assembly protein PilF